MDEKDDIVEVPRPDPAIPGGAPESSADLDPAPADPSTASEEPAVEPVPGSVVRPHLYRLRAPGLRPVLRPRRHRSRLRNDCPPDSRPPARGSSRGPARLR